MNVRESQYSPMCAFAIVISRIHFLHHEYLNVFCPSLLSIVYFYSLYIIWYSILLANFVRFIHNFRYKKKLYSILLKAKHDRYRF